MAAMGVTSTLDKESLNLPTCILARELLGFIVRDQFFQTEGALCLFKLKNVSQCALRRLGCDIVVLGDFAEDSVTTFACFFDLAGFERKTKTLGSGIRFVNGQVAPPDSAIVPQMVVGVIFVDSNS